MQIEGELAAAREKLALLEDEKCSLQIAVDQAFNETARLTRRLTESDNTLSATRAQLGKVETSFAEAHAERGRLAATLDETREQRQAEQNSLNMRLDALQSRAGTAERLLAEARQNLIVRTEEARAEGALEAARKDNSRLQSEVAALRSTLRRGLTLDEAPMAPSEAANDEVLATGKKGKNAETA